MSLTAKEVNEIFDQCLFLEDDDLGQGIRVLGMYGDEVLLHEGRIMERVGSIKRLLKQLHDMFRRPQGACFLSSNIDRLGCIWTDNPKDQDRLFMLGVAISAARIVLQPKAQSRLLFDVPFFRVIS